MINHEPEINIDPKVLFPDLSPEQQEEAGYYFSLYINLVRRIFERNYGKLRNLTGLRRRP